MSLYNAHLRAARPPDHMDEIICFYCEGLGFELIGAFEGTDGYRVVLQRASW